MNRSAQIAAALLLIAGCTAAPTEDPAVAQNEPPPGVISGGQELVIHLPEGRRADERVVDGHQPWRRDLAFSAQHELKRLFGFSDEFGEMDDGSYVVVRNGRDTMNRPTAVVERNHRHRILAMDAATIRVHLYLSHGEVWIATKIVLRERPA